MLKSLFFLRLSNYDHTKLINLLNSIPSIVTIVPNEDGQRVVKLVSNPDRPREVVLERQPAAIELRTFLGLVR